VEAAVDVSRLLSRCRSCCGGVEAAVKVSRLLSRCRGCCRGVEAAVEVFMAAVKVFKAAVEVEAAMYRGRYRGRGRTQERALVRRSASVQDRCRGVEAAVEVSVNAAVEVLRLLSGAVEVLGLPSRCSRLLSNC
jgi:hypothetical protein